jgi:hypothetical protein
LKTASWLAQSQVFQHQAAAGVQQAGEQLYEQPDEAE